MKLNKEGRDELRTKIALELQDVPSGQRIHLDKGLLEELLFETIVYNKETRETLKIPFWSGEFLSKIDLSEVSFDNVSWSLLSRMGHGVAREFFGYEELIDFEMLLNEFEKKKGKEQYYVNYSNTNASIDFSRSFEALYGVYYDIYGVRLPLISGVNFYGVDFSNLDISMFSIVDDSNLGNTGIRVTSLDKFNPEMVIENVSFENLDLSSITINASHLIGRKAPFISCVFINSKLNIIYDCEDFKLEFGEKYRDYISLWTDLVKSGSLNGCYINGKLIELKSKEEIEKSRQMKLIEYEKYKQDIFLAVSQVIDKQKKYVKK